MTDVYVANVLGEGLIANDMPVESNPPPLLVGTEGLIVQYGDRESGITVLVLADDLDEAEAIILRAFGDEGYLDSIERSAPVPDEIARGVRNLSHAGTVCSDPECEIHHPERIEGAQALTALAWFNAGKRAVVLPFPLGGNGG